MQRCSFAKPVDLRLAVGIVPDAESKQWTHIQCDWSLRAFRNEFIMPRYELVPIYARLQINSFPSKNISMDCLSVWCALAHAITIVSSCTIWTISFRKEKSTRQIGEMCVRRRRKWEMKINSETPSNFYRMNSVLGICFFVKFNSYLIRRWKNQSKQNQNETCMGWRISAVSQRAHTPF